MSKFQKMLLIEIAQNEGCIIAAGDTYVLVVNAWDEEFKATNKDELLEWLGY